ncbi:hypothetical protein F5Y01DRAFT_153687 [Xylaria sp. FL0043]|nr:hypothetical protein F5Y01DRAFT_153687 [Xylaria sp. FL0043]
MVNQTGPRGQYSRPAFWHPGRIGSDQYSEEGRLAESSEWRGPPWTIDRSLRELCQIPGNTFFVAAEENGRVICLSTPIGSSQLDHVQFFDEAAFVNHINQMKRADPQSCNESDLTVSTEMNTGTQDLSRARTQGRPHYLNTAVDAHPDDGTRKTRKRPRAGSRQPPRQNNLPIVTAEPRKGIRIGDSDAVYAFYDHHLKYCQQTACKIIAKAWVKAVAPKKQSTHPYTRGSDSRPDWWPKMYRKFGEDTYKDMRHKEPDHLGKEERVYLLCHILRLIVEPEHKRHPAIRKVNLNLSTLEAVTFEALSSFFGDKDSPANKNKRPLLKDIFKIARQEARYKDNEISGNTEVFVTSIADRGPYNDEDSDSDDEGLDQKFTPAPSDAGSVDETQSQMMMSQVQVGQHNETNHFPGHTFTANVAIRAAQYSQPEFESELSSRQNYVESPGVGNQAPNYSHSHLGLPEMYSSPQATSRRSSVFNSPSEYGSPATPVTYSPWPTSNATSNPSMYGFPPQPPSVQAFGQLAQGPSYVSPPPMDGLPRQSADPHHGDLFASGTVGQCTMPAQPGYQGYVTDGALVTPNAKSDAGHHPSIHQ